VSDGSNTPQMRSRSYIRATEDREFLLGPTMRGARFMIEYEKINQGLEDYGIKSCVLVFGSARIPSPEEAEASLRAAKTPHERMAAERGLRQSAYYETVRELARIVSLRAGALRPENGTYRNVVATGGGPGLMEAANRGAHDVGAPTVGFCISIKREPRPNSYCTPGLTWRSWYFSQRKFAMAMRASAIVVAQGGFGTMDELFEYLTLVQTGKAPRTPIVLLGHDYWNRLLNWNFLVEEGMIDQEDLSLFDIADSAEEA
jgi:uncharacterized protein (TIGR00730 family)